MNGQTVDNSIPHSMRGLYSQINMTGLHSVEGTSYKNRFQLTDYELIWTIEVPGIDKDDIEVIQVNNKLRVTIINDAMKVHRIQSLEIILAEKDKIETVSLELGQLHIHIERNLDIVTHDIQ